MASSDDEYEYDDSEDEEDFKDDDDDADNMDWKPQLGNGDNPNAPPVAGTFLVLECVDDFVDESLQYECCSLTPLSPPPCSNVHVNAPRVPISFPQTTCLHRHGHFFDCFTLIVYSRHHLNSLKCQKNECQMRSSQSKDRNSHASL
jgi:hypothetical protein